MYGVILKITLNRTTLELKQNKRCADASTENSLNRTTLELKPSGNYDEVEDWFNSQSHHTGIETVVS